MTARITPGGLREIGPKAWVFGLLAARVMGTVGPPHVFATLGRHRRLLFGWLRFSRRLMPHGRLPRRETELVILRVARLCGSEYELGHHRRMAARSGLCPAEVAALTAEVVTGEWSVREAAILTAVAELHAGQDLGDVTWRRLRAELDERECIELCLLVGNSTMLAMTLNALRVEPDAFRATGP